MTLQSPPIAVDEVREALADWLLSEDAREQTVLVLHEIDNIDDVPMGGIADRVLGQLAYMVRYRVPLPAASPPAPSAVPDGMIERAREIVIESGHFIFANCADDVRAGKYDDAPIMRVALAALQAAPVSAIERLRELHTQANAPKPAPQPETSNRVDEARAGRIDQQNMREWRERTDKARYEIVELLPALFGDVPSTKAEGR